MSAPDPVAALLLAEADPLGGAVLVVDDRDGSLCWAALASGAAVFAACDDLRDGLDLPDGVTEVDRTNFADLPPVDTVLWRLPRAVDAVADTAQALALACPAAVRVFAGGRDKHLVHAMNDALAASFGEVSASRGQRKARVLRAAVPLAGQRSWPQVRSLAEWGIEVATHGGVFAGGRLDQGTRLLLQALEGLPPGGRALDLGCGSGVMASVLARWGWQTSATDVSALAVASSRRTFELNGVEVTCQQAVGIPDSSDGIDLVVCNPPFHRGAAKDSTATFELIADAGRALRAGGELWLVYNPHLPYLPAAFDLVGPTRVAIRHPRYLVTCSTKAG